MKRIKTIILAGLAAIAAISCDREELATFNPVNADAPVLLEYSATEDAISASFSPAVFNMGFNEKVAANHFLVIVSVNDAPVEKALTASAKDGVITVKNSALSKTLMGLGYEEGSKVSFDMVVRASLQTNGDNGKNGYIDSEGRISVKDFEVTIPVAQGNPWENFTEVSTWSVIGDIASAGLKWNGDIVMYTDGSRHVARNVKLTTADQFKFRNNGGWDENFGGTDESDPFVASTGVEYTAVDKGKNISVAEDGSYDLVLDVDNQTFTVYAAFQTYPGFDQESAWSVIGSIASFEMVWNKDIAMTTDGEWHVAEGVELTPDDQFKFRKDQSWDVNIGAVGDTEPYIAELDTEIEGLEKGKNLAVAEAGTYDLLVNPDAKLFKVVKSLGGKSGLVGEGGGETPPEPTVKGWNIIGLNGDWDNDVLATAEGNVWTAFVTATDATSFKWRKDAGWDENYGGTLVSLGTPFAAVAGGDNIELPSAGFYKVVLDLDKLEITVSDGNVWSLIGDFNSWSGDVDMTLTDGKWVSPVTKISAGGFKIRRNHDWTENVGGVMEALGIPFAAIAGGDNIAIEEENDYVVTYDPEDQTILVEVIGWGVVGTINSWGGSADLAMKEENGMFVRKNVTLTADDEIKVRYRNSWDVNYGGRTDVGFVVEAISGGDNLKPGAGTYDIWLDAEKKALFVMTAGAAPEYWGVVGTINGWGGTPDAVMYHDAEGYFVAKGITLAADDEIKIRKNSDWTDNRGASDAAPDTALAAVAGGDNIKVAAGTYDIYYQSTSEKIYVMTAGKTPADAQ